MPVTLKDAAEYAASVSKKGLLETILSESLVFGTLPPAPPLSRWERLKRRVKHVLGYRVVLRRKDDYCEEDY